MNGKMSKKQNLSYNSTKVVVVIIFVALFIAFGIVGIGIVSAKVSIGIDPASTSDLNPGDSFAINVSINPEGIGVTMGEVKYLTFNPAVVQCDDVVTGDFFGTAPAVIKKEIDNVSGTVWYTLWDTSNTEHTTPGTFATVTFTVKSDAKSGTDNLDLTTVELANLSGPITPIELNNATFMVGEEAYATESPHTPTSPQTTPTSPTSTPTPTPTPAVTSTAAPPTTAPPTIPPTVAPTATPVPTAAPTPTPEEPGFEAVFAIAGLLAVAYLVLRRKK